MQICVPPNIDLICGLILIFYVGFYQSPTKPTIYKCFRQVSLYKFAQKYFYL